MWRWILLILMALVVPVAGLFLFVLILLWLNQRKKEAGAPAPAIEIDIADAQSEPDSPGWEIEIVPVEEEAPEMALELPSVDPELPNQVPESPAVELDSLVPEPEVLEVEAEPLPLLDKSQDTEPDLPESGAEEGLPSEPDSPDDLKRIQGIGPKIASVLNEAGILTFAQLAATEVGRLQQILAESDSRMLRLADPSAWPQQAELAAAEDWDGLDALRGTLRAGGREK
jgi:predicted flap endonuclease-1-like 5' DNA nuclease